MEGHHPHPARDPTHQSLDPLAHLVGGLVRERDREDLPGLYASGGDQPRDAVGQDACLPGAGAGEHEQRTVAVCDRLALGRVQLGEQALLGRRADLDRRARLLLVLGHGHDPSIATPADPPATRF
jgi:hypothetical protein